MLEVITGCMYSGKTNAFLKKVKSYQSQGKEVMVIKPERDARYARYDVVSHDGLRMRGVPLDNINEIWEIIDDSCEVLAIDEAQFFEDWDMVDVIQEIVDKGIYVLVAGLNLDFRGQPYGVMPNLIATADIIDHRRETKCKVCGEPATRSQRLVYGEPAAFKDDIYAEGEGITYEPRCRKHHIVKKQPDH